MDIDTSIVIDEDFECRSCGRRVCELCAVVNEGRTCLECATKKGV